MIIKWIRLITLFSLIACLNNACAQTTWRTVAPGIEYTAIVPNSILKGHLHAFRIDLNKNKLDLALASDLQLAVASVKNLAEKNKALIAINGGFFSPQLKPLGLRIKQGEIKSVLKFTSWWGVFYVTRNKAHIIAQRDYISSRQAEFAVQGGPRLVVNGDVTLKLKSGINERTALGITLDGKVIIVVTDNAPLDMGVLANIMQASESENGLACYNALNLDGGGSTQLFAQIGKFSLNIPGFSFITDAVLVLPSNI